MASRYVCKVTTVVADWVVVQGTAGGLSSGDANSGVNGEAGKGDSGGEVVGVLFEASLRQAVHPLISV